MADWTRYECMHQGGGGKFWAIRFDQPTLTVETKWGKLTDPGMMARNTFATVEQANKHIQKKVAEKTRGGYNVIVVPPVPQ